MFTALVSHFVLLPILLSPVTWILAAIVAVGLGFYFAPTQTLTVLTDARTWLIGLAVVGIFTILDLENKNATLAQTVASMKLQTTATADGVKAVEQKQQAQITNTTQVARLRQVAATAPTGTKEDDVLDQIAADDAATPPAQAPTSGATGSAVDKLLDSFDSARP